ncbi:MAG: methyltransferase domain-containing protein [Chloroflexota bacterium]
MKEKAKRLRFEALCYSGLEPFLEAELAQLPGIKFREREKREGAIVFRYGEAWSHFKSLRIAREVRWISHYEIPRPKAFLGHQTLTRLFSQLDHFFEHQKKRRFKSVYVDSAGRESVVMQRLRSEIASYLKLEDVDDGGDLHIGFRRDKSKTGWEVWMRTTPRPLSLRQWRSVDYPGALNGTLAAAMVELCDPQPNDQMLNLMCGSGSLMAEWMSHESTSNRPLGGDILTAAMDAAAVNLSTFQKMPPLFQCDSALSPFPSHRFDIVMADLPWGQLIGSSHELESLYPALLEEVYRLLKPGGQFVLITQAIKLFERSLSYTHNRWEIKTEIKIREGNFTPRIYQLVML